MNDRFEILQGEGKQSNTDRLLQMAGFAIGVTKGTVRFGINFTTEIGDALMYGSGQKKYATDLKPGSPKTAPENP